MNQRSSIDPALGLNLVEERTLTSKNMSVSVVIPAHNEEQTIRGVVFNAWRGLEELGADGEVIVSASACTDQTSAYAKQAGATVVEAPEGKGSAVTAGTLSSDGDVICLVDGDLQYYGNPSLVALLVQPITQGLADAVISDLYWRPLYPQLWLHGFWAPLAGAVFPELVAAAGSTPWSGQRAAHRHLWPTELPDDFTVDLELLLHWNEQAERMRPVLADDWTNPQRPKPELMARELDVIVTHAVDTGRLDADRVPAIKSWFERTHEAMAQYDPSNDDPQQFERNLLQKAVQNLHQALAS